MNKGMHHHHHHHGGGGGGGSGVHERVGGNSQDYAQIMPHIPEGGQAQLPKFDTSIVDEESEFP